MGATETEHCHWYTIEEDGFVECTEHSNGHTIERNGVDADASYFQEYTSSECAGARDAGRGFDSPLNIGISVTALEFFRL